jgi:spermidine synthase
MHLGAFFIAAMVCHGELVRLRPHTENLTEFYLFMSVGGVLGGIFNAIVAPLAFDLLIEYSIALALVCYLRPGDDPDLSLRSRILDVVLPVSLGSALIWAIVPNDFAEDYAGWITITVMVALLGLAWSRRRVRFSLWIWALLVAAPLYAQRDGHVVFLDRSFFGVSRVVDFDSGHRGYYHGTTLHGTQNLDPRYHLEPTTYFARSGPFGDIADVFLDDRQSRHEVIVMGLGIGTLACYGRSTDYWRFLEIDPLVAEIAGNPNLFTYLSDCPPKSEVLLGDARLTVSDLPDGSFDLIVADAFSSDAVPVHLLTREAIELYMRKIRPGGAIAFNVTNRYVDLEPVLADLARTIEVAAAIRSDDVISAEDRSRYDKRYSVWVVVSQSEADLAKLYARPDWRQLSTRSDVQYWTDEYSNIVTVLR